MVPFDAKGNMLSYELLGSEMRVLLPFDAALGITGIERGMSAARFVVNDGEGRTFPVFLVDFLEITQRLTIVDGVFEGRFKAVKRGQNYGIGLE